MRVRHIIVIVAGVLLTSYAHAHAGGALWSTPAAGCIVDTASASKANVSQPANTINFAGSNTGYIHVMCPITPPMATNPSAFFLIYTDTDATDDGCWIYAYLYREAAFSDGSATEIAHYSGYDDGSLNGASPYNYRNREPTAFTHTWSSQNYYYLSVDLYRDVTTCQVTFNGAQLDI